MSENSKKLAGKVAIVTGASKGIGAEVARQLGASGASVVVNYSSSRDGADKVVADIVREGGKAVAVQGNVAKQADVDRLLADSKKAFGAVDILINNAGIYDFAPLENVTEDQFHKQFNVNVLGLLLTTQAVVKQFGPAGGSIVNISSVASKGVPNAAVYSATKGAVDAVTKSLAIELGPRRIRVNAINPGMVETEGVHAAGFAESDFRKQVESQTPLGRIGQPIDIATAVVFLTTSDAAWITGETIQVAGGFR